MADVHLGAAIRGLQDAIAEAYERAIDAALANKVDFVVLAGDAFDTSRPSYGDYLRFFAGLDRLAEAEIPLYLIAGNHDPFTTWARDVERLPDSAHLIGVNGPEFTLFERDGEPLCLIGGRSYYNQSWPADENVETGISRAAAIEALAPSMPQAADSPFMVGVIHTGLDIDMSKARSDLNELLAADVDYWACGHLHQRCVFPSEASPRVVFSGCVQGRDIKESGERGCFLVELERTNGGSIARWLEFIPTSSIVLQHLRVDVGACQTLADVARLVQAQLFHENGKVFSDEMVVRVSLTGATALHGFLRRRDILEDLRKHINNAYPSFFCDALVDFTRPVDTETFDGTFPAVVATMADEQRGREEVLINYVQNEFVKRGIPVPSALSRRVGVFNDAAEALVLDLLREGEGELAETGGLGERDASEPGETQNAGAGTA